MSYEYIAPEDATHLRVFQVDAKVWNIDAVDEANNYTEVCWDSRYQDVDGKRHWTNIETLSEALELAQDFARENTPHLVGTEPRVKYDVHYDEDQEELL